MEHEMGMYDAKDLIFADRCKTFGTEVFTSDGVTKAVITAFTGYKPHAETASVTAVAFPAKQAHVVADGIMEAAREMLGS